MVAFYIFMIFWTCLYNSYLDFEKKNMLINCIPEDKPSYDLEELSKRGIFI